MSQSFSVVVVVAYVILAVLVGLHASKKSQSAIKFLLISILFTPVIGFIVLWFTPQDPAMRKNMSAALRRCPFCSKHVPVGVLRCPHCNKDVPEDLDRSIKSIVEDVRKMSKYKINYEDGVIKWGDRVFSNAIDAIAAAEQEEQLKTGSNL
jgi:hypothetical protein